MEKGKAERVVRSNTKRWGRGKRRRKIILICAENSFHHSHGLFGAVLCVWVGEWGF